MALLFISLFSLFTDHLPIIETQTDVTRINDDSFETCISGKDFESITPNTEEIASTRLVNTGFLQLALDVFSSVYNADCWSADLFLPT